MRTTENDVENCRGDWNTPRPDPFWRAAPDAHAPDAHAPDAHAPDAYAPDAHAPDAYAPDAHAPDAYAPDAAAQDAQAPLSQAKVSPSRRERPERHVAADPGPPPSSPDPRASGAALAWRHRPRMHDAPPTQ
jgi:hypothetical protein